MDIHIDYSGNEIGKYFLIEKLGNGGFGAVYKAYDRILRAEKAIKILEVTDPNEAYKLFNEAAIPYRCKHNHIVKINSGEIIKFNDELLFVVDMELANGESVDSLLKHTYISIVDSLDIMRDILFAVEYSHLQGIIHRDIKPANILIDNGVPKLSDFGLSTALGNVIVPWRWYRTHAAPETFVDDSVATVETDIFALGMTLYRMINGISDWNLFLQGISDAEAAIRNGKLIDKLPIAPFVPNRVQKIVKKACKQSPKDRFHSAMDMRNAIEKLCPLYNWNIIEENYWRGEAIGCPVKDIYIELKRNSVNVVVTNNGRKSAQDSEKFNNLFEATQYMMEYIKNTTLR
ncbi:MAG: serine/threonine protein kinase [Lachnospiraceae bacterium]|nr:serine/threonine protein kinase [Lachnospiraceae bacterium]